MKLKLKLGTRKSLLAWAQSSWVAREVERLNPGTEVELCGIVTQGDRILDVPLQKVEGKEFFVAEIDQALMRGEVDFTVHSMKDLSLDRPSELTCGAVPQRENPRDVVLFNSRVLERLREGRPLRIGTSSPRRLENIPSFLESALPHLGPASQKPQVEFVDIRGNVNSRLSRIHQPLDSPLYLDAVVLAFAGIIRLWADPAGQLELQKLLHQVRWMILPLRECPAAPAQGALSVECRATDSKVIEILKKLHHLPTSQSVARERQLLKDWGGGCHQRFGATAFETAELGNLLFVKGRKSDNSEVDELRWNSPLINSESMQGGSSEKIQAWDGSRWRAPESESFERVPDLAGKAVFIAHSRAVQPNDVIHLEHSRNWTSGTASWFRLAKLGLWVEGCAEGLGFDLLVSVLTESVLRLPSFENWVALTHSRAAEEWKSYRIRVIPTYKINFHYGESVKAVLQEATHLFWSSGSQFDELKHWVSSQAVHSCGPGKTAVRLRAAGINPMVFPSSEEWRRCLNLSKTV